MQALCKPEDVPLVLAICPYKFPIKLLGTEQVSYVGLMLAGPNLTLMASAVSQSIELTQGKRYTDNCIRIMAGLVQELTEQILAKTFGDY